MEVRNKKIIVTGAASGIGEELVKQLLDKGAKVVAVDVNKENLNKYNYKITYFKKDNKKE